MKLEARLRAGRERAKRYAMQGGHSLGDLLSSDFEGEPIRRFVGVCSQCGRHVVVGIEDAQDDEPMILIEGAATFKSCVPNALKALEGRAWLLGQSPLLLKTRLQRAIEELGEEGAYFNAGEFQPHYGRWLSDDGLHALQWKLRDEPLWPISPDNPQGAWGIVELQKVVDEEELMPARYVGQLLDPNDDDTEEEWQIEPLRPEESGFAYRDDEDQWRFKRMDGTVGFFVSLRDLLFELPWLDVEPDEGLPEVIEPNDPALYP